MERVIKWLIITACVVLMIFGFILMLGDPMTKLERALGAVVFAAGFWVLGERCR